MNELVSTEGRISRSTFWKFFAIFYIAAAIVGFISKNSGSAAVRGVLGLLMLPLMVVAIMVQIRRWHDRDKSGWWVLINLVPCIGFVWVLVELGCLPGTTGENRFGPDPLQR
jgi:uncharacterized membrane protein YhaH (DUF805 family)